MRTSAGIIVCLCLAGCGGGSTTIEGSLLDPADAAHVWVDGSPDRAPVHDLAFRVEGVRGDTVDLRFASDDADAGTMRILGLGGGGRLVLHGIWFRDDRAFPTAVELEGPTIVTINALRMASPSRLPDAIDAEATLLALAGDRESLIVRPANVGLPDLRVVITPATAVRSVDGDPASLERLSFGDTLTIRGVTEAGYVVATDIVLPRRVAAGIPQESESAAEAAIRDQPAAPPAAAPASRDPPTPAAARESGPPTSGPPGRGGADERPGRGIGRDRGGGPGR